MPTGNPGALRPCKEGCSCGRHNPNRTAEYVLTPARLAAIQKAAAVRKANLNLPVIRFTGSELWEIQKCFT